MKDKVTWGIIAPGVIANALAVALKTIPEAELLAVASRSNERAKSFAEKYNISRCYDDYKKLAEDEDIDVVYIANPHSHHKEAVLMCLEKGKAVLCEKPIGINKTEMLEMAECAKRNNTFLMEAMWTRFLPVIKYISEYIEKGFLGDIVLTQVNFGFKSDGNASGRLLNPELAGGALLDIGVYALTLADIVYNKMPLGFKSIVNKADTGVDEESEIILNYSENKRANISLSCKNYIPNDAIIVGTKGVIKMPRFFMCTAATIELHGEVPKEINIPFLCNGYEYEIMEVISSIKAGKIESSTMTHDKSLRILNIMDSIRKDWGLVYPMEIQ